MNTLIIKPKNCFRKKKLNKLKLLVTFSALLVVIALVYTACQKQYNPGKEGSLIENARNWFTNDIVRKEKEMIEQPYSVLPSSSPLRRFARMRGLNELLNWSDAKEYNIDGIHFVIAPVDQDIKPLNKKHHEASLFIRISPVTCI